MNLSRADLHSAIIAETNLSGANLSGANLQEVISILNDLSNANLSEADLRGANLNDFENSLSGNLTGADLRGADLNGAILPNGDKWQPGYNMSQFGIEDGFGAEDPLPTAEENAKGDT